MNDIDPIAWRDVGILLCPALLGCVIGWKLRSRSHTAVGIALFVTESIVAALWVGGGFILGLEPGTVFFSAAGATLLVGLGILVGART